MKGFPEKLANESLGKIVELLRVKKILSKDHQVAINIASVSDDEIKRLNGQYRHKDEATDILSFSYNFDDKIIEGDLILCWEIIQKNAEEDGIKPEKELIKNLIHGCLHLTGREHSGEMFDLQNEFLDSLKSHV